MKLLKSQNCYQCSVFGVEEREYEYQGQTFQRSVVTHPGAVVIIPETEDGSLFLVRQFRQATGKELFEFPAGTLETSEEPLACARREVQEECGMRAASVEQLGTLYPAPGFCNEIQHVFLARNLSPVQQNLDEDEFLEPRTVSVTEIFALLEQDDVIDGKTLASFVLYLRHLMKRKESRPELLTDIFGS
jgi:ADP-ribose pyrophosphatase